MMFIRSLLIFVLTMLIFSSCQRSPNDFSESLSSLQKNKKDMTTLYFYQGTLKMLNFSNDSALNMLIKDVKKMKLLYWTVTKDSVTPDSSRLAMVSQIHSVVKNLEQENFVSLMQYHQDNMQVMLFLKKQNQKPVEFVGIFYDPTAIYIIDMLGKISPKALPALLSGKMKLSGFQTIWNTLKPESTIIQPSHRHDRKNSGD